MEVDVFLQKFGSLLQDKDGIQKLRCLILQLAVSGKLVEQSFENGEARIPESAESGLFAIPNNWVWTKLSLISSYIQRGKGPKYSDEKKIPVVSQKCVQWSGFNFSLARYIDPKSLDSYKEERFLIEGDLLWNSTGTGTLGRVVIYPGSNIYKKVVADSHVTIIRLIQDYPRYIWCYLASPYVQNNIQASGSTNQIELSTTTVKNQLVPLPPIEEQKRIVTKIDELFNICDQLELEQKKQKFLKFQAVDSTLHYISDANTGNIDKSSSILNKKFGEWFEDLRTVKSLRATILQLAVQGKLEHQDPNNEPAEQLIARINKKHISFKPKTAPFDLPLGWSWASFPQLGEFGRGKSKHRPRNDPKLYHGGKYPLVQTGDVSRANGYIFTFSSKYNDEGLAQSKIWPSGTMCITIAANIAETGILTFDACFPDSVVGFIPDKELGDSKYFEYFLRTAKCQLQAYAPATAQKNINLGILNQVAIPLPPINELKRIVTKIDDMLLLCDQLEDQVIKLGRIQGALFDSLISQTIGLSIN